MQTKTHFLRGIVILLCVIGFPISTFALTNRVNIDTNGIEANNNSSPSAITPDGRFTLFTSVADNLVPGDTNGARDIFVRDSFSGTTIRVNIGASGNELNNDSTLQYTNANTLNITDNGRYVLFYSAADNVVPDDTNWQYDIFVRDLRNNTTILVSSDSSGNISNGYSYPVSMSADGRYVLFYSDGNNLVPGDTNANSDVFVKDLISGTTTRVSVDTNGVEGNSFSNPISLTPDGRYALFVSTADNFASGDNNFSHDVFVRDMQNNTTTLVTADSSGNISNNYSEAVGITPDGRYVLFNSYGDNLVPGDTNGTQDVFVRDLVNNTTVKVSTTDIGDEGNNISYGISITPDGRYVLFNSDASNLVPGDVNRNTDAFIRDIQNNTTIKALNITLPLGFGFTELGTYAVAMSSGGRYVLFNVQVQDSYFYYTISNDLYISDTLSGTVSRVDVDLLGTIIRDYTQNPSYSNGIALTPDGRYVLFNSDTQNLVVNDTNGQYDVFVNQRQLVPGASPVITSPSDGSYRNTLSDIVVEGIGNSGSDIRVTFLGNQFTTIVNPNGEWAVQLPSQLDATYTVYAQQKAVGSGAWSLTGSSTFTIDTINPDVPTIVTPIENELVSGGSMYVVGVGEVGGTITVKVGNTTKVAGIDGMGNWNVGPFSIAPGYKYGIVAKQSDLAGNQSNWSDIRTIYGVLAGTTGINIGDYKPELVLTKRGVGSGGNTTTTNPNENIRYTLDYVNAGNGYATGVVMYEKIPTNTCFTIGSITGLSSDYVVEYSHTTGVSYVYSPVGVIGTQDCAITNFRVRSLVPYEAKLNVASDEFDGIKNNILGNSIEGIYINNTINLSQSGFGTFGLHYSLGGIGGDFNNDGKKDIVTVGLAGQTTIYTNISTGNTIMFSQTYIGLGGWNFSRSVGGDFNYDGKEDILLLGLNGQTTLFTNISTGSTIVFDQTAIGPGGGIYFVGGVVADFNNDGKVDVVGLGYNGQTMVFTNISTGNTIVFDQTSIGPGGLGNFGGGTAADFNNDGKIDILGFGFEQQTTLFTNISTGNTVVFDQTTIGPGGGSYFIGGVVEDFNGDNKIDAIGFGNFGQTTLFTNISTGNTVVFDQTTIGPGGGGYFAGGISADLNGDNRKDVIGFGSNGQTTLFTNISTGNTVVFDQTTIGPGGGGGYFDGGVVGDFNNDGIVDVIGIGRHGQHIIYTNFTHNTGTYTTILNSSGNITAWNKILVGEEVMSGMNKLEYSVYGVTGGSICNTGNMYVGGIQSIGGEINISNITGSSICVKVDFSILTGSISPVLKSIIGLWGNETMDSFVFDVKVKSGGFSGTTVTNMAYISASTLETTTGNNISTYIFGGLPLPVLVNSPIGGFGGGGGGGNGGGSKVIVYTQKSPITETKNEEKKTVVIKGKDLTPQEVSKLVEEIRKEEKKDEIKKVDIYKPISPIVEIKTPEVKAPVTTVTIVATTPNLVIKEAIVQTSYVSAGSSVEIKTQANPVLEIEKKCYTPKEVVDITLGKNTTNKDQLVYQALLKSYDLTMFSDTDTYKPENGLKRYEAAKMFTNFAKHVLCRESKSVYANTYTDIEGIDETLRPYIIQAYEYGILRGSNNTFRPLDKITRKEFVAALMRMFTNANMDVENGGNNWDINYQSAFKSFGLESIVGVDEEINRYAMSKIMYKLYYNTTYEWTEKGYVLPYGRN